MYATSPHLCRCPPLSLPPCSPTCSLYCFGKSSMKAWACAILDATITSSRLAEVPYAMFSWMVPENRVGSCGSCGFRHSQVSELLRSSKPTPDLPEIPCQCFVYGARGWDSASRHLQTWYILQLGRITAEAKTQACFFHFFEQRGEKVQTLPTTNHYHSSYQPELPTNATTCPFGIFSVILSRAKTCFLVG